MFAGKKAVSSATIDSREPPIAPSQKLPLMIRSTRPRQRKGDQLVDRGVDGRVLAADAEAREERKRPEPPGLEGDGGQGRGPQIHRRGLP